MNGVNIKYVALWVEPAMDIELYLQNKRRAFQVLSARLMDQKITREIAQRRAAKNSIVKSADRSEKIRTYNYAQVRVVEVSAYTSSELQHCYRNGSQTIVSASVL